MRGLILRALLTALVVGPLLTAINQGAALAAGEGIALLPAVLTLIVPMVVSFTGGLMMRRALAGQMAQPDLPDPGRAAAHGIVAQIHQNARRVNHASRERLEMLDALTLTADGLRDVLAGLSDRADENRAQLDRTRGRVDEMAGSASSLGERAGRDLTLCHEVGAALAGFGDACRAIERLAAEIREIVTKTGLLATNAGIEAARSGDAGRGFKVVAVEVGALASRTGRCAVDIDRTLERLSARMTETRRQLDALVESLGETSAGSRQGTEIAAAIAADIQASIALSSEITRQMGGAQSAFGTIAERISRLRADSEAAIRGSAMNIGLAADALGYLDDQPSASVTAVSPSAAAPSAPGARDASVAELRPSVQGGEARAAARQAARAERPAGGIPARPVTSGASPAIPTA